LSALRSELTAQDELVVVDSASAPPVQLDEARVVRSDVAGSALARNLGWRSARHECVAFVDDDVRVLPGWADALVDALSRAAFVAGAVGVPAEQLGVEQPVAVTTLTAPTTLTASTRGTLGATANLGVRVDALRFVGGFDERLGPGTWAHAAEDLDLLDRLFAAGYTGEFAPSAAAVHDQWRSRRQLVRLQWGYGVGQGARLWLLLRTSRRRAWMVLRDAVWQGDVVAGVRSLRDGYQLGAVVCSVRLLGTVSGVVRAAALWR
jgi:GT2 family glycosyltransferase